MQAFVTQQQIGFIKTLCDELDRTLEGAAQELFGLPFGQLDRAQASEMIDALLAANPQLVTGAKGLAERGLDTDADCYGMIPGPYVERLALTRRIIERLEATRPPELGTDDYVRAVLRTPGFWKDGYNQITLWLSD